MFIHLILLILLLLLLLLLLVLLLLPLPILLHDKVEPRRIKCGQVSPLGARRGSRSAGSIIVVVIIIITIITRRATRPRAVLE